MNTIAPAGISLNSAPLSPTVYHLPVRGSTTISRPSSPTILKFVYAGDNSRGVRAEKIIAQPGIEQEVLTTIFGRALVHTTSMYVATDDGIMPAITYYANMEK